MGMEHYNQIFYILSIFKIFQIKLWSKEPDITYIGSPAQSWIDDYFGWSKDCCRSFVENGTFCPSDYVDPEEASSGKSP